MWCEHVQTSVCDSEWYECGSEHLQMSLCVQVCVSTQEHMRGCECECVTHLCGACVMGTYECSACVLPHHKKEPGMLGCMRSWVMRKV